MKRLRDLSSLLILPLAACSFALPSYGGDGKTDVGAPAKGKDLIDAPAVSPWHFSSDLQLDYAYAANDRTGGKSISAQNSNAQYVMTAVYKEGAPLRFGFDWDRYSFGGTAGTAIPNTLQAESFIAGVDLELFNSIFMRIEADPGWYSASSRLTSRAFNVPVIVGMSYLYNKDLQLVLGVSVDPKRYNPVLPGGGIRWQISDHWLLDAVLPKPRLQYEMNKQVTLYGGANILETTFHTDGSFGTALGNKALNSSWLDYTEIRAGAGATLKVTDKVNVDLEVGYTMYREFDYHRANTDLHSSEGGVYGGISIGAKF